MSTRVGYQRTHGALDTGILKYHSVLSERQSARMSEIKYVG